MGERHAPSDGHLTRRRFAQLIAASAAVTAAGSQTRLSPTQSARAAPWIPAGVGVAISLDWALRQIDVLDSDDPPEGITGDSLLIQAHDAFQARESTNASTFKDNQNIIEGIDHVAYADAKIAAIDALNDQQSQSEVTDAAHEAVNEHEEIVISNFLNSWNESIQELVTYIDAIEDHPDVSFFGDQKTDYNSGMGIYGEDVYEFSNGNEMEVHILQGESYDPDYDDYYRTWSPVDTDIEPYHEDIDSLPGHVNYPRNGDDIEGADIEDDSVVYLSYDDWNSILQDLENVFADVRDGISLWVDQLYDEVQSGDLDPEELLTPRELAEMTADEEEFNQAVSDLMALNVAIDLEREAEVFLPNQNTTLYGQIAYTGDGTLSTGTIDPSTDSETYYLSYDISQSSGTWDAYDDGVDGGEITFTEEPFERVVYHIHTTAGETAEIDFDEFEEENSDWVVDASGELDDQITEIESVDFYAQTAETQFETIHLKDQFEIVSFVDSDGEEHEESEFARTQTHDDENYITQEEWEEQRERHEELIKQYEDSGGGIGLPGFGGDLDARTIIIGALLLVGLGFLVDQ